jgi:hypothetical protein
MSFAHTAFYMRSFCHIIQYSTYCCTVPGTVFYTSQYTQISFNTTIYHYFIDGLYTVALSYIIQYGQNVWWKFLLSRANITIYSTRWAACPWSTRDFSTTPARSRRVWPRLTRRCRLSSPPALPPLIPSLPYLPLNATAPTSSAAPNCAPCYLRNLTSSSSTPSCHCSPPMSR